MGVMTHTILSCTRRLLLVLLVVTSCTTVPAQIVTDSTTLQLTTVDDPTYRELAREVRYEKDTRKLLPKKPEKSQKKKKKKTREDRDAPDLSWLNGIVSTWLMYGLIAGLVLLILYVLLKNVKLSATANEQLPAVAIEDEEIEEIEAVDTDGGYEQAMAAGDYRRACRMVFLKVLQRLQATEKIRWKKEKTNRHYLREMAANEHSANFRALVTVYEKVWYGNKPIDRHGIVQYATEASHIIPIKLPAHE